MSGDVLVRMVDVRKSFSRFEGSLEVLRGVTLDIGKGESVAVVGVSGAGKSTLLNILGGLEHASEGNVIIGGSDLRDMSSRELAYYRNESLGFVFQFHHLLPEFTALENVMMPALIGRVVPAEARERATEILTELGLEDRLGHKAGELSGGEQQRVAIARAIIMEPALILADEPTGNLDAATGAMVEDILLGLNREKGITLLIVTHNEALAHRMNRVIRIRDGRIESIEEGSKG